MLQPAGVRADVAAPGPARTLDLKALYENVRDAVNAVPLPPYVAFTVENASKQNGALDRERLQLVVRESDGAAVVRTLRDADGTGGGAYPQVVTTPTFPMTFIYRAGDFPLEDFGMRVAAPRPGVFDASGTPEPAASGDALRTLATVTVIDLPYRMTDLGPDTIGGRSVFHIGLVPVRDPGHHVLRQMWIDPVTYLPLRYVAERFVDDKIPYRYRVTVDTAVVDGHLVNVDADGHFVVRRGDAVAFAGDSEWTITGVAFPAAVPSWAFDAAQLYAHRDEPIPGL